MINKDRAPTCDAFWFPCIMEICDGEFPYLPAIACRLRESANVPVEVREFLADFIEGKIKRPRGKPKNKTAISQYLEDEMLLECFERHLQQIKKLPKSRRNITGTPSEEARARTIEDEGLSIDGEGLKKRLQKHKAAVRRQEKLAEEQCARWGW